jgi:hypothetical protein
MTHIPDMTPCDYFPFEGATDLVAIGWLENGQDYSTGPVPEEFYRRLEELLRDPWQPIVTAGTDECSLCQFEGTRGTANLWVPFSGRVFVAPELILHYVNCHHYQPPDEFVDAVLECPDTRSMAFKRKLIANGGGYITEATK